MKYALSISLLMAVSLWPAQAQSATDWSQEINVRHADLNHAIILRLGTHPEGSFSFERTLDTPAPPFFHGLRFDARIRARADSAAIDFRHSITASEIAQSFDLDLYAAEGGAITLSWPALPQLAGSLVLALEGQTFDLSKSDSVRVTAPAGSSIQGAIDFDPFGSVSAEEERLPSDHRIALYPNPFQSTLTVALDLGEPAPTTLTIYNALGERIGIMQHGMLVAGTHQLRWEAPAHLANGIYFLRIQAGDWSTAQKAILYR